MIRYSINYLKKNAMMTNETARRVNIETKIVRI